VSLAERLRNMNAERKGPPCTIGVLLEGMTKEDACALTEALADPALQSRAIWRALVAEGYEITDSPVTRHRKGLCLCSRIDSQA
jgi:hypothetical protein